MHTTFTTRNFESAKTFVFWLTVSNVACTIKFPDERSCAVNVFSYQVEFAREVIRMFNIEGLQECR